MFYKPKVTGFSVSYSPSPQREEKKAVGVIKVYYRKADNTLGEMHASDDYSHKDAILTVKEALVANGDDIHQRAVLALIQGGKNE